MTHDSSGTHDVHTYLTTSENSKFAGQDIDVVDRWQGRDNLLWRCHVAGQEVVLKLFMEAGQVRADRQFSGQEYFSSWGLAPRPLWQDRQPDPIPRPVLVYEWSEGEAFTPAEPAAWEALAAAVARIHNSDPGEYNRFSPHPVNLSFFWRIWQGSRAPLDVWLRERNVELLQRIFRTLWQEVDQIMNTALPRFGETAPALIHGDLLLEHVLLHRGQTLLVDWELFGLGDPAQEIARFFFFNGQAMENQIQQYWQDRYLSEMNDPGLAPRIELYRRMLPFQSLTALLNGISRELGSDPAQIAELETNRPFLVETVVAALLQSMATLLPDPPTDDHNTLIAQVDHLLRQDS